VSHNGVSPPPRSDLLDSLDDAKISRFRIKIMFVSGMGLFTDAYDLFVIGIVAYLLTSQWNLSTSQISLLNSITLAACAVGLIVGPLIASIFLASGLSDNLTWRLLLGLGAIAGLAVFYLRRQIHETPRFATAGGATEEAEAAIAEARG
jgi:MFS family permease